MLLPDSAPSHPRENIISSDNGLIIVKFFLPIVTVVIQLTDQEVIASMKQYYQADLLGTFASKTTA
jgi:hypothetical protein